MCQQTANGCFFLNKHQIQQMYISLSDLHHLLRTFPPFFAHPAKDMLNYVSDYFHIYLISLPKHS